MKKTNVIRRRNRKYSKKCSKKRTRIANKGRFTLFCVFCLLCTYMIFNTVNSATASKHSDIFIMTVSPGDTLWAIATENNPRNMDVRDVVDDIIRLNRMTETNLCAGEKIIVPVY